MNMWHTKLLYLFHLFIFFLFVLDFFEFTCQVASLVIFCEDRKITPPQAPTQKSSPETKHGKLMNYQISKC